MAKDVKKKNFQYIDSFYIKPKFDKTSKEMTDVDHLCTIYRDLSTGQKKVQIIHEPKYTYYVAKDTVEIPHHISFIEKDKVTPVTCKFRELTKSIAEYFGMMDDYYREAKRSFSNCRNLFNSLPEVFMSDMDIVDYKKGNFLDKIEPENPYLTKAYFDIEVDGTFVIGFPDQYNAECPINAITLINDEDNSCHTFLLRNKKNPQIAEFEKNIENFKKECKKDELLLPDLEYNFYFFDEDKEIELIAAFFDKINELKPDFATGWNTNYDNQYMLNRTKVLGYEPTDIMCSMEFPEYLRRAYFIEDKRHQKYSEKTESFEVTSYTVFLDALLTYASLRKGLGEKESYTLNFIAQEELGDSKLDYSDTSTIKSLPYDDYKKFVRYNIKDTILLKKLEDKNDDIGLLYEIAQETRTRITKAMKKTVSLKNLATKFYSDQGFIISNNPNVKLINEESEDLEKFDGAIVGDPVLNEANGMKINGKLSKWIFQYVIDFDLTSLYPSIIISFNVDPTTQYGRLYFKDAPPTKGYDKGGEFLDDYESKDVVRLANKYFDFPSTDDLAKIIESELINS